MDPYQIIVRPVITEKSNKLARLYNQYTFEVDPRVNKIDIRRAVEGVFDVEVLGVSTCVIPGKRRRSGRRAVRRASRKKAIVTLHPGQTIEGFDV